MPDTLTTITKLIQSPPGQLAAGGVLAGIVWKFFERVEAVLTDNTKLEIAVWLLGRKKFGPKVQPWPDTFAKLFDRVFGTKHLSMKCFFRSCIASVLTTTVSVLFSWFLYEQSKVDSLSLHFRDGFMANILPDYVSLLKARVLIGWMRSMRHGSALLGVIVMDFALTLGWALFTALVLIHVLYGGTPDIAGALNVAFNHSFDMLFVMRRIGMWYVIYPMFFTSIWLWLYAGSGFILKAARRFDVGFDWFNRHFDIEKKPLQSIGLVAGALVAIVYWTVVVVSRVVG
jgi:hypothetical protein